MTMTLMFTPRRTQVDLRFSKSVTLPGARRVQVMADIFNAFNSNAVQSINTVYGANWLQPLQVLDPRIFQFSGQLSF